MRVVKIGGRPQADPHLPGIINDLWQRLPGSLCIVHGGGDEMSAMQRALGKQPVFVGGRRVTSEGDIELLRMVLSGVVNKRLVSAFTAFGLPALGISGEDGELIGAQTIDKESLGFAGRPTRINTHLLRFLINAGYLPVISPVGCDLKNPNGGALNVNGDDAAAAIAAALGADELLLVSDVEGVRDAEGTTLQTLSGESGRELIASGTAVGGMAAKLESAHEALTRGVGAVRICDLRGLLDDQSGTFITLSQSVAI
jgi:acetylglutamate kinase